MSPDYSSVWAKFHRAEEHIDTFEKEVMAWAQSNPYRVAVKHNADCSRYWAVVREIIHSPNLERWSLVSGDAVHNLRCALDHLVYSIAIFRTQQNPPPRRRDWVFPIRGDQASFQSTISNNPFPRLGTAVLKEIERFQPYNRPHRVFPPLLTLLQRFNNSDKHHILRVAAIAFWGTGWDWDHVPWNDLPQNGYLPNRPTVDRSGRTAQRSEKSPSRVRPRRPTLSSRQTSWCPSSRPFRKNHLSSPACSQNLPREVRTIIERICRVV